MLLAIHGLAQQSFLLLMFDWGWLAKRTVSLQPQSAQVQAYRLM